MSERHYHRPALFLGLTAIGGVTFYRYRCECGHDLPERRIAVPGITLTETAP